MRPRWLAFIGMLCCMAAALHAAEADAASVRWLEGRPEAGTDGATWGVAWPRGAHPKDASFTLRKMDGDAVPLQSWPLATWPDGSLKWSAHAIGGEPAPVDTYALERGEPLTPPVTVRARERPDFIAIDTGRLQARVARHGEAVMPSLVRDGREVLRDAKLVALNRDKAEMRGAWNEEAFTSVVHDATLEQAGPVRAVVKVDGAHIGASRRVWLPFTLRFYFYADTDAVRIMHTFVFDGDVDKDFISGLGLRFSVPMRGELHDRHVRFVGDGAGLFGEAVRGVTGLRRDPGADVRDAQVAGRATPPLEAWEGRARRGLPFIPAFGDYSLRQSSPDAFQIRKRTQEGYVWLDAGFGRRASGLGYVGSPEGGVAFGLRNFWQSHPAQLDIRHAATDTAEVTVWLWSPEAQPMDLRFYHDGLDMDTHDKQNQGMDITYEDYEAGYTTAHGIARTSEITLHAIAATPSREETVRMADRLRAPPQPVCAPEDYLRAKVFGDLWSLPDRSTPFKEAIENQMDFYLDGYIRDVDQRRWYGFWHYGDVMHSYDGARRHWSYDVGGMAWANSELSPDLWFWYAFLRSGRADVFRMAEAMTRHTGEVDVYHLGRFKGLGTRHGVVHWGDSSKQLRISTAAYRRFYYYLTADERVGDLLWEQVDADLHMGRVDVGRKLGKGGAPTAEARPLPETLPLHPNGMNTGTDWYSVASAVLTAWERTGDPRYGDKLRTSMESIAALPNGLFTGGGRYDAKTGRFYSGGGDNISVGALGTVFGGVEINAELLDLIDVPEYARWWLLYCELYNGTSEDKKRLLNGKDFKQPNLHQPASRKTAYAAYKTGRADLAARAWNEFARGRNGVHLATTPLQARLWTGPDVLNPIEAVGMSTNAMSQWGLSAIQCLRWIGDHAPGTLEAP